MANALAPVLLNKFGDLQVSNPPEVSHTIPGLGIWTVVTVSITGGKLTMTHLSFSNLEQSSGGKFSIDALITATVHFSNWQETDVSYGSIHSPSTYTFNSPHFSITFQKIALTITVEIELSNNNLLPANVNLKVTDQQFTFTLPLQSCLNSIFSCVQQKVNSTISNQIKAMTSNMIGKIQSSLNNLFSIIPESGKLTSDIQFLFQGTPGGLAFPDTSGAQYRVLGKVQLKGQDAPGDVGVIPFPTIPPNTHDAIFFLNTYVFDALFWAFYKEGSLHSSFDKNTFADNVIFQQYFDTNFYAATSLKAIAEKYPNRNMVVNLVLSNAPSVQLSTEGANISYSGSLSFWLTQPGSVSEKDPDGELFSIVLKESDMLDNFAVSTNSSLQLVTFKVTSLKDISMPRFISDNIKITKTQGVEDIWTLVLRTVYVDILGQVAKAGVPLPSTLQGIFTNCNIEVCKGYASAAVNFTSTQKYESILQKRHGISLKELKEPHVNLAIL